MSQPKERGFRRLTLGLSLVLLLGGLALTGYDIRRFIDFRNAQSLDAACLSRAGSGPTAKTECVIASVDDYMPRHVSFAFDVLLAVGQASLSQKTLIDVLAVVLGPRFFLTFTICLGLAGSLVFAAIPWAVFYFGRWISG
jgi:hypothetical protein